MTRRKGAGEHHGRAVLGPNGEGKITKRADKMPKKKKKLTYLERIGECDVSEELRVSISLALKKLETSEDMKELELPSSLTAEERKYVHIVAQQMGFKSKSRGLSEQRRLVLMKKDDSEKPLRQRSWKRRALKYGGVQELLKQKAERRKVRDMEAENERLMKLEEEKCKVLGFEEPTRADSSSNGSSTSKSNEPSEVQSSDSHGLNPTPHSSLTRLPMRRNETSRHLHHPGASRRCSEGDASYSDHHGARENRNYHPRAPFRDRYSQGRFGSLRAQGDISPVPPNMRESPHLRRPSASSPDHFQPLPREGAEAQSFSRASLRGHPVPTRDHSSQEFGPRHEQGPRAESGPVPFDFFSRPPPSHPYIPRASSPRRRHSLNSPGFFNTPPPLANSPGFHHYSSHENIRSSEYSVVAPSEPKWSDYGYYSNSLGSGAGPEFASCSTGEFYNGAAPPNAPSGANVAFPPPDHSVLKTEPPEVKYEPYDPLLEPPGEYRRSSMPPYQPSNVSNAQASSSHYPAQPSRFPDPSFHPSSYSNISVKVEPLEEYSAY